MSILGLFLGIIGLAGTLLYHPSLLVCVIWVIVCLAGIINSAFGIRRRFKGAGIAGLILSIIGIIAAVIMTVACAAVDLAVNTITNEVSSNSIEQLLDLPEEFADIPQDQLQGLIDEVATASDEQLSSIAEELAGALAGTDVQAILPETPVAEPEAAGNDTSSSPLVGVWHHGSYAYTFNADGTGDYGEGFAFTYTDNGTTVSLKYESGAENEFGYRIDGNTLYIKDSFDREVDYTR